MSGSRQVCDCGGRKDCGRFHGWVGLPPREGEPLPPAVHHCSGAGYCDTCDELGLNTYHGGMW